MKITSAFCDFHPSTAKSSWIGFCPGKLVKPNSGHPKCSYDFNRNPMCSVLLQSYGGNILILEEMILPDSYTLAACEELLAARKNGIPDFRWRSMSMATPRVSST